MNKILTFLKWPDTGGKILFAEISGTLQASSQFVSFFTNLGIFGTTNNGLALKSIFPSSLPKDTFHYLPGFISFLEKRNRIIEPIFIPVFIPLVLRSRGICFAFQTGSKLQ